MTPAAAKVAGEHAALVVDDDEVFRNRLCRALEGHGWVTIWCTRWRDRSADGRCLEPGSGGEDSVGIRRFAHVVAGAHLVAVSAWRCCRSRSG